MLPYFYDQFPNSESNLPRIELKLKQPAAHVFTVGFFKCLHFGKSIEKSPSTILNTSTVHFIHSTFKRCLFCERSSKDLALASMQNLLPFSMCVCFVENLDAILSWLWLLNCVCMRNSFAQHAAILINFSSHVWRRWLTDFFLFLRWKYKFQRTMLFLFSLYSLLTIGLLLTYFIIHTYLLQNCFSIYIRNISIITFA